jgi:hypothetical protein
MREHPLFERLWNGSAQMEEWTAAVEWADRARKFVKPELKRADMTYEELAHRLETHGLKETDASVANKLRRGTFATTFFLATMAAIGREGVRLEEL